VARLEPSHARLCFTTCTSMFDSRFEAEGKSAARFPVRSAASLMIVACLSACAPATSIVPLVELHPALEAVEPKGSRASAPIAWSAPADADDLATLAERRKRIGPPVVSAPDATAGGPQDTLVIVTWNTHAGRGDLRRFLASLRSGALTHGVPVSDFVLLLQEVTRLASVPPAHAGSDHIAASADGASRDDIVRIAADERLHLFYAPNKPDGGDAHRGVSKDRGNGVLSTLPLSNLRAFELPFERERRVALAATVTIQRSLGFAEAIDLVDVHLENRAGRRRLWLRSAAARNRQTAALVGALSLDGTLVVGGDLNTWSGTGALLRIFQDGGLTPLGDDPRPTFGAGGRLDYILARVPPTVTVHSHRVDDRFESDHYPVLACFHW
jgi:endonuclease/exonuclease/phosphatase family metal-dependent hydrolase